MRIATGEETDDAQDDGKSVAAKELGWKGGQKCAANMSPERRAEIAKKAAAKRWASSRLVHFHENFLVQFQFGYQALNVPSADPATDDDAIGRVARQNPVLQNPFAFHEN
ncbi:hypothetical protein ACWGTO_17430 [Mesorhizobium sp. PL10]